MKPEKSDAGPAAGEAGGKGGGPLLDGLADPNKAGSTLAMIQRAVANGWQIPDSVKTGIPAAAVNIAADRKQKTRDRLRAMELLASLQRNNLDAMIEMAKLEMMRERMAEKEPVDDVRVVVEYHDAPALPEGKDE